METKTKAGALLALAVAVLVGCGDGAGPDVWGALPPVALLEVPSPASGRDGAGHWSASSDLSRPSRLVAPALSIVDRVTRDRWPEEDGGPVATWRTVPSMTDPVVWRFRVRLTSLECPGAVVGCAHKPGQTWEYTLEGKPKMGPDSAFVVVMRGTRQTPEGDDSASLGSGTVAVDWNAARPLLDPSARATLGGTVEVRFHVTADGRTVEADIRDSGEGGPKAKGAASYKGEVRADGSGAVTYWTRWEYETDRVGWWSTGRVRWQSTGAGRFDALSGKGWHDAPVETRDRSGTCWDANLSETFRDWETTGNPYSSSGDPSACSGFAASPYQP